MYLFLIPNMEKSKASISYEGEKYLLKNSKEDWTDLLMGFGDFSCEMWYKNTVRGDLWLFTI